MRKPKPGLEETAFLVGRGIALGATVLGTAFLSGAAVATVQKVIAQRPAPPAQVEAAAD
jgi:F0F1-type ATP synthase membrane subunit c/vacuolar-type H+-ATPase subunit K